MGQKGWNWQFIKQYLETGTISCIPGSGGQSKLSVEAARIIDEQMEEDEETTGKDLRKLLCI